MTKQKALQFIGITPGELIEHFRLDLKKEIETLKEDFQPKKPKEYLTRNEVAKLLSVDISTVHNWTVKKKLISYGIGNRVYYLRNEVEQALKPLNK